MQQLSRSQYLYPPVTPYDAGRLEVGDGHSLYYEQSGAPDGKPAVVLHGGPGGGTSPEMRQYFDPQAYRIILFDQRGCGKSTPHASLEANTTWDLVADIERLRNHLGVKKWQVFGGSWGSTLALAYAQTHGQAVSALVLRGIFLLRAQELHWFYQYGAHAVFPDHWEKFIAPIAPDERDNLLEAYHRRLNSPDREIQLEAARAWSQWEARTVSLQADSARISAFGADAFATAFARIECHYFINKGFLTRNTQLLDHVDRIRHIPGVIVQGRFDMVTPMMSAWALHKAWPEAKMVVAPDAGHAASEPGITRALVAATDQFKSL